MPNVALKDIVVDPTVQIRRSNHEPTIQRYEESFDRLPPVTVFKTPQGLLLADGFHRIAAADRLGKKEIAADVRKGTREDALEYAVIANTRNADPLSNEERDDGIRRLKQLHPNWSIRTIADKMSISPATVSNVFKADEVARSVFTRKHLSTTHYRELARAPKETWEPLATAAAERDWTAEETAQAVRNLRDKAIPPKHRHELLAGKTDPVVRTPNGDLAVTSGSVSRRLGKMAANDAILAFQRALENLAKARLFRPDAIIETADGDTLAYWVKELPGDISFLQDVLNRAKKGRGSLRVVDEGK